MNARASAVSRPTIFLAALAALALSLLWVASPALAEHDTAGPAVTPTEQQFPGGDPICPTGVGVRFQGAELVNDTTKGNVTITNVDVDGGTFDFAAGAGYLVSYVFAKGGTPQNVYNYSGFPGGGVAHDDGLAMPTNPESGKPYGISHIDFCVVQAEESESESPSEEQSVSEEQSQSEEQSASGEQSVEAGTGTPSPSVPDGAMAFGGSNPIPTVAFGLILLASLAGLAFANVKAARSRI